MREIKWINCQIRPVEDKLTEKIFAEWLNRQAQQYRLTCALAFADDGLIWGRFEGKWHWSGEVFPVSPRFRPLTLQQIRLFGRDAEVFLWRSNDRWLGRVIIEGEGERHEYLDEPNRLWGRMEGEQKNGFALMQDSGQGLRHAPPLEIALSGKIYLRHYLAYDDDGCVKIIASRLIDVEQEKTK